MGTLHPAIQSLRYSITDNTATKHVYRSGCNITFGYSLSRNDRLLKVQLQF